MAAESWEDITVLCREAAAGLSNVNPMIHTEGFSLYDTMSAIELLDPKMDQCHRMTGSINRKNLLTVGRQDDPITVLLLNKTFSALIAYEVAYIEGSATKDSNG